VEVFATFGLIMLVTMAIPIALLFSALVFDLAVVIYVVIGSLGSRKKTPGTAGAAARYSGAKERRRTVVAWAH
jgi:hypothetical protein